MISALIHLARLTRAGYVFARAGVFGIVDPAGLPSAAQFALRLGRLIQAPQTDKSIGRIASGSFGRVYRGDDPRTGQVVAVKVLRNKWTMDKQKIDLFLREG